MAQQIAQRIDKVNGQGQLIEGGPVTTPPVSDAVLRVAMNNPRVSIIWLTTFVGAFVYISKFYRDDNGAWARDAVCCSA